MIYFIAIKWAFLEKTTELQKASEARILLVDVFLAFVLLACIFVIASDLTMCSVLNSIVDKWVYEIYIC